MPESGGPIHKVMLVVKFLILTLKMVKGRHIQNDFFQADVSSKKLTNEFDFTTMIPQVNLFSFVFWKKLKTLKIHFEIN